MTNPIAEKHAALLHLYAAAQTSSEKEVLVKKIANFEHRHSTYIKWFKKNLLKDSVRASEANAF